MDVRRAERDRQGDAARIGEDVALGARLAAVGWIGSSLFTPLFAEMLALSTAARLQSMALACPNRSSRTWCRRSQTPACCQSRRRRQHTSSPSRSPSRRAASPGNAALEHKQDAAQRSAVGDRRPTTLRFRPLRRDQRRNQSPQLIGYKRCCHARVNTLPPRQFYILLGALALSKGLQAEAVMPTYWASWRISF